MDLMALLSQLADAGIGDLVTIVIVVLFVRYSASETRREISKEIDDKIGAFKSEVQQSFQDIRQEITATRTTLEQSIKENRQEIAAFRTDTRQEFNAVRTDSGKEFDAVRTETRQELSEVKKSLEQSIKENRQAINGVRTYSEQAHQETRKENKEIMLHLIDVRERLANIEGRLGAPTPRMSAVSPPLDTPAEEPSAQS